MRKISKDIGFVSLWVIAHLSLLGILYFPIIILYFASHLQSYLLYILIFAGIIIGGMVGIVQIIIIRLQRKISYYWIITPIIANIIGIIIVMVIPTNIIIALGIGGKNNLLLLAITIGIISSILQYLLLKNGTRRLIIWMITCIMANALIGFTINNMAGHILLSLITSIFISSLFSGLVLLYILREEK